MFAKNNNNNNDDDDDEDIMSKQVKPIQKSWPTIFWGNSTVRVVLVILTAG